MSETVGNVSFKVQRTLGFFGEVTVDWVIFRENGSRASHDFVQPSGSLLFAKGEKQKVSLLAMYCCCLRLNYTWKRLIIRH